MAEGKIATTTRSTRMLPTVRRIIETKTARERAALRLAALVSPDPPRLESLLEEAERRQKLHEDIARERPWPVLPTAGLDSVYEDVCHGRL